ncbi:MAG TPA: hypothetical protein VFA63_04445 [Pseudonocardiaceae bacterium]|nr:hypothetical protein [Pseudonocardiaceae bacterium]
MAVVLDLLLLGLVWLVGLTAVHCVTPGPLRRWRQVVRVAEVSAARLRPQTSPRATLRAAPQ